MNALFVWTLIVLSSMSGAALICESLRLNGQTVSIIFTVLVFVGVLAQSGSCAAPARRNDAASRLDNRPPSSNFSLSFSYENFPELAARIRGLRRPPPTRWPNC